MLPEVANSDWGDDLADHADTLSRSGYPEDRQAALDIRSALHMRSLDRIAQELRVVSCDASLSEGTHRRLRDALTAITAPSSDVA